LSLCQLSSLFRGKNMIDLHTHTTFSDGVLIPSELIRRAENIGYRAIAITDHCDYSNYKIIVENVLRACEECNKYWKIKALAGVELTHNPPETIPELAKKCRKLGAQIIIVHGETITEPVFPGTNKAAVLSDIDILAHPGLIEDETMQIAAKRGIYIEITAKYGHSLTNGHVAKLAKKYGAKMVINTDTHTPSNLITKKYAEKVLKGAGLNDYDIRKIFDNSVEIVKKYFPEFSL